jgi:hypothetical protein
LASRTVSTHAAVPPVGLDDHEGLLVDAVFLVLAPHLAQQRVDACACTQSSPARAAEVDLAALGDASG